MYKLADKFFIYSVLTLYFSCFLFSKFFIISFHEILCIWYFCESLRLLPVVIRLMVHAILITPYRVFNFSASCNRRQFFFILKDLITLYYSFTTIYLTYGFYYKNTLYILIYNERFTTVVAIEKNQRLLCLL